MSICDSFARILHCIALYYYRYVRNYVWRNGFRKIAFSSSQKACAIKGRKAPSPPMSPGHVASHSDVKEKISCNFIATGMETFVIITAT